MTKVNLIEARKPTKADPARTCYVLRWWTAADKYRAVTLGVVGTMTKRQAVLRQRRKQGEFDNDLAPTDRPGVQPLKAFFEADREAVAVTVAPKTLEDLRIAADHAVRALGEDFDLHKMGHAHIGRIATAMDKRGLARATWVKVLSKLQAACSRGVKRGDLKANPFVGYRYPKVPRRKVDTFSAVEVAAMIGAAPSLWWRVLIRLAYTTGLRRGEMLNLQWDDIDFAGGVVKVQAKRAGVTTICGRLLPTTLAWESKSHNNRQVPVPAATLEALADLRDYSAMTDHDGQRPPQTAYVFISLRRMANYRPLHGSPQRASLAVLRAGDEHAAGVHEDPIVHTYGQSLACYPFPPRSAAQLRDRPGCGRCPDARAVQADGAFVVDDHEGLLRRQRAGRGRDGAGSRGVAGVNQHRRC